MTDKPHMTLPNGDKLYEGDYGMTRDGRKVGPLRVLSNLTDWQAECFEESAIWGYHPSGRWGCVSGAIDGPHRTQVQRDRDIIAKWYPEPAAIEGKSILGAHDGVMQHKILDAISDKPKTWSQMSDAEKGALLLAHHDGKSIQNWTNGWRDCYPIWDVNNAYRVKPEPTVEAVTLFGKTDKHGGWIFWSVLADETHKITFNLIDGKPDCASIKMEALK